MRRSSPRSSTPRRSPRFASSEPGLVHRGLKTALFLAAVVLPLAVLYNATIPISPGFRPLGRFVLNRSPIPDPDADPPEVDLVNNVDSVHDDFSPEEEKIRLEKILKEAAMDDKTVIVTTLNEAWASPNSVVDIFIESFRIGFGTRKLLEHVVMVALDKRAYDRCITIHMHCFALFTQGVDFSGEQDFMSEGYLKMMWRRIDFLRIILEIGYNFIFTDVDVVWFRNPMPHFHPDGDFQIACDHFVGNETDLDNIPNGGFNYVKSNNQTIKFYKFWYLSKDNHPGLHDQDVLNFIKHDPYITKLGLKMRFLSTAYFGGICEPSRDLNKVCTMHANCCIGLGSKIHDLNVMLQDWRTFMSMPPAVKRIGQFRWRVPQNCSLEALRN